MNAHRRSKRCTGTDDLRTGVIERSGCASCAPSLGNRSLDGIYTDEIGTRKYKLYLSCALRKRAALFVVLHGASQTASDFTTAGSPG